jgi:hypothetical protein
MYSEPHFVYTCSVDKSPGARIVWDEHNLHHILIERAERGITPEDIEHMLADPDTVVRPLPTGADLNIGRAPSGRPLAVVTIGMSELYPKTAWWVSEKAWRRAHE